MKPEMKIVPRSRIVSIEKFQPNRVAFLESAFLESGYIFNPLLVTEINDGRYMLMDDESYLETARRLKIPCLPVQIHSLSDNVELKAKLAVRKWDDSKFNEFQTIFPRDTVLINGNYEIKKNNIYILKAGENFPESGICIINRNDKRVTAILPDFLAFIKDRCDIITTCRTTFESNMNYNKQPETSILNFGNLHLEDVLFLGESDFRFPAGFFKFDKIRRVLGINFPIRVLNDGASVSDKQSFLNDLISLREQNGRAEYFDGGVYLLNY